MLSQVRLQSVSHKMLWHHWSPESRGTIWPLWQLSPYTQDCVEPSISAQPLPCLSGSPSLSSNGCTGGSGDPSPAGPRHFLVPKMSLRKAILKAHCPLVMLAFFLPLQPITTVPLGPLDLNFPQPELLSHQITTRLAPSCSSVSLQKSLFKEAFASSP